MLLSSIAGSWIKGHYRWYLSPIHRFLSHFTCVYVFFFVFSVVCISYGYDKQQHENELLVRKILYVIHICVISNVKKDWIWNGYENQPIVSMTDKWQILKIRGKNWVFASSQELRNEMIQDSSVINECTSVGTASEIMRTKCGQHKKYRAYINFVKRKTELENIQVSKKFHFQVLNLLLVGFYDEIIRMMTDFKRF